MLTTAGVAVTDVKITSIYAVATRPFVIVNGLVWLWSITSCPATCESTCTSGVYVCGDLYVYLHDKWGRFEGRGLTVDAPRRATRARTTAEGKSCIAG